MLAILDTYPSIAEHLAARDFVVQQQNQYSFSRTSMDQTIEQTMNRDSKTRGGQVRFSNNAKAVHYWILSFSQDAEISKNCTEKAEKTEG